MEERKLREIKGNKLRIKPLHSSKEIKMTMKMDNVIWKGMIFEFKFLFLKMFILISFVVMIFELTVKK